MDKDVDLRRIYISPLVRAKIYGKHGLEDEDVLDACHDVINAAWVHHEERGWRLFVEGWARTNMRLLVVLYPTDDPMLWEPGHRLSGITPLSRTADRVGLEMDDGAMDEDEMTPEAFRAAMASGVPARLVPGPRPTLADRLPEQPTIHVTTATIDVSVESQLTAAPIRRSTSVLAVRPRAMIPAWK